MRFCGLAGELAACLEARRLDFLTGTGNLDGSFFCLAGVWVATLPVCSLRALCNLLGAGALLETLVTCLGGLEGAGGVVKLPNTVPNAEDGPAPNGEPKADSGAAPNSAGG